jgi:hypothetical protein
MFASVAIGHDAVQEAIDFAQNFLDQPIFMPKAKGFS